MNTTLVLIMLSFEFKIAKSYNVHKLEFIYRNDRQQKKTEFGTMCNALKCFLTDNCRGFLLPIDTVDLRSRWRCDVCSNFEVNLSDNQNSASFEAVKQIYEKMDKEIKMIDNLGEDDQVQSLKIVILFVSSR